jgi:hypothetical protein
VNVESGLEANVALLDRADVPNMEALDPDQIAWASSAKYSRDPLGGRSLDTELGIQQSAADLVDQGESVNTRCGPGLPHVQRGEFRADSLRCIGCRGQAAISRASPADIAIDLPQQLSACIGGRDDQCGLENGR